MTDDPQTGTVDQLILDHLDRADLPETAEDPIIAGLLGDDHLTELLGGTKPQRPRLPAAGAGTAATACRSQSGDRTNDLGSTGQPIRQGRAADVSLTLVSTTAHLHSRSMAAAAF